jgi:hypothetical protein
LAAAARQKRKHQAGALWRAAVHTAPHFEGAVPALQAREVLFYNFKLLAPNEGGIAKNPEVLRRGPVRQDGIERGRGEGLVSPIGEGHDGLVQNRFDGSSGYFHWNLHASMHFQKKFKVKFVTRL